MEAVGGTGVKVDATMSEQEQRDFRFGMNAVLDYLEGFWMGLERKASGFRRSRPLPARQLASELRGQSH